MRKASPPEIVLASQSPRRRELAEQAGWVVTVLPPPETAESEAAPRQPNETLEAWVARLARVKAEAIVSELPADRRSIVLACDTIGVIDDTPLGKPANRRDAAGMLTRLSGRLHRVLTGSCLWPSTAAPWIAVTESLLEMEPLTPAFLEHYLETGLWRGKAGACGFQDGVIPLRLKAGSGSNVIGLPLETIRQQLGLLARRGSTQPSGASFSWYPAASFPEPSTTQPTLPPSHGNG